MDAQNNKIAIVGFSLVLVCATLYATVQFMEGVGFGSFVKSSVLLVPLVLAGFLSLRRYWTAIALGCIPLGSSGLLSVALFDQLSPLMGIIVLIFILSLAQKIIRGDRSSVLDTSEARAMLFLGVVITGWFLYQRPGAFRLGASGGGVLGAVRFLLAGYAFWGISYIVKERFDAKTEFRTLGKIAVVIWLLGYVPLIVRDGFSLYLFERESWMLFPLLLVLVFHGEQTGRIRHALLRYVVIFSFMPTAVFSAFRSRPLFFLVTVAVISFFYRKMKSTFLVVLIVLAVALTVIVSINGEVPVRLQRQLSLVVPGLEISNEKASELGISGESGWKSEFRAKLLEMTWEKTKRSPWLGYGSKMDYSEAIRAFALTDQNQALNELLLMGGGSHNLLLAIMVSYGIPAMLAFLYCYTALLVKFMKGVWLMENSYQKMFCVAICGMMVSSTGQALMNGGAIDLMILSIPLGLMNGLLHRDDWPGRKTARLTSSPVRFGRAMRGARGVNRPKTFNQ